MGDDLASGNGIGKQLFGHLACKLDFLFAALSLEPVIGGDVSHLVRQHGGDLRGIIGECQKSPGDVEESAGQREGVDSRRIQHGYAIGLLRVFRNQCQGADNARHQALCLGVTEFAAITCNNARVLICANTGARIGCARLFCGLRRIGRLYTGLVDVNAQGLATRQRKDAAQDRGGDPECSVA